MNRNAYKKQMSKKGDPNGTRLLAKLCDRIDLFLVEQGFEFAGETDEHWQAYAAKVQQLVFEHYNDVTGGDSSYDPNEPDESGSEESVSAELVESEEEESMSSRSTSNSASPKKRDRDE